MKFGRLDDGALRFEAPRLAAMRAPELAAAE
jgi:hypothetical protein